MLTVEVKCSSCQSNRVIKFRLNSKGKQRDQCRNKDCAKDPFIFDYENQGYLPAIKKTNYQYGLKWKWDTRYISCFRY